MFSTCEQFESAKTKVVLSFKLNTDSLVAFILRYMSLFLRMLFRKLFDLERNGNFKSLLCYDRMFKLSGVPFILVNYNRWNFLINI